MCSMEISQNMGTVWEGLFLMGIAMIFLYFLNNKCSLGMAGDNFSVHSLLNIFH